MHHPCIPHLSRLRSAFPRSPACRSRPAGQLLSTARTSSASRLLPGGTSFSICRRFQSASEPSKKRSTERCGGAGDASLRGRLAGGLSRSSRSRFGRCCSAGSGTKVTTRRYCCGGASHCLLPPAASQCPPPPAAAAAAAAGFWPANVDVDKGAGCAGVGTASAAAAANSVAAAGCTGCTGCAATAARNSAAAAAAAGSLGAAVGAAGSTQRITASTAVGSSSCAATQGRPRCRAAANTDGCCAHCHAVLSRQQAAAICGCKAEESSGRKEREQTDCPAEAHLQGRLGSRHPSPIKLIKQHQTIACRSTTKVSCVSPPSMWAAAAPRRPPGQQALAAPPAAAMLLHRPPKGCLGTGR